MEETVVYYSGTPARSESVASVLKALGWVVTVTPQPEGDRCVVLATKQA